MFPIKLVVFVGIPGARADFIAGWLGKLPSFVESSWSFDPVTGQSITLTQHTLTLDHPDNLPSFLDSHRYFLSPDAALTYPTKVHSVSDECRNSIDPTTTTLIDIDLSDSDLTKITWEGTIKTMTRLHRLDEPRWVIDQFINKSVITDIDRIDYLNVLLKASLSNKPNVVPAVQPSIMFNKVFKKGGSRYVASLLGLVVDDIYHSYWDYMLPLAETPASVTFWGHTFKLDDYIN